MSVQINEQGQIKINVPGAKVIITGDCDLEKLQAAICLVNDVMEGDFTALARIGELFAEEEEITETDPK